MTAESRGDCSGFFLFVPGGDQAAQGRGFSVWRLRRPEMEAGWWRVGGVAEKQGVSLPRGIGHIPRIPLPHFWTGVGEKGAGALRVRSVKIIKDYLRASQTQIAMLKYAMRGCIPLRSRFPHLQRDLDPCQHLWGLLRKRLIHSGKARVLDPPTWPRMLSDPHRRGNRFDRKLQGVFPMLNARVVRNS